MTTATQQTSGSAWFSKLVVVSLLALAIGLYLRIVMVEETGTVSHARRRQACGWWRARPRLPGPRKSASSRDLPEDQMAFDQAGICAGTQGPIDPRLQGPACRAVDRHQAFSATGWL